MRKQLKQRWTEALLSGDYRQGGGTLRTANDGFCCLGVLCDLVDPDGWTVHDENDSISYTWNDCDDMPEQEWLVVLGLYDQKNHRVHVGKLARELANMNDKGVAFTKIAEHISKTL